MNLAPAGDTRIWQGPDFIATHVSATLGGKNAFVSYISPTQINILTPPDTPSGPVQVVVNNNGSETPAFSLQAQPISTSFFVFNGGSYVAAVHTNGNLIGPATLYPGASSPAKPGETIMIYANGFGPTSIPITTGSVTQSGPLSPLPVVQIGNAKATVTFAGLVAPGEFQFNVVIPTSLGNGDQPITATYGGQATQSGTLITVHN